MLCFAHSCSLDSARQLLDLYASSIAARLPNDFLQLVGTELQDTPSEADAFMSNLAAHAHREVVVHFNRCPTMASLSQ